MNSSNLYFKVDLHLIDFVNPDNNHTEDHIFNTGNLDVDLINALNTYEMYDKAISDPNAHFCNKPLCGPFGFIHGRHLGPTLTLNLMEVLSTNEADSPIPLIGNNLIENLEAAQSVEATFNELNLSFPKFMVLSKIYNSSITTN